MNKQEFRSIMFEILEACREKYKRYVDLWELTITTTTNAVINKSIWAKIIPLVDEFTVSYHAENLPKQERLFFNNLLELKTQNKRVKCVVMMHNHPDRWAKSIAAVEFCKLHNIKHLAKPFDQHEDTFSYSKEQFGYFKTFWLSNINNTNIKESQVRYEDIGQQERVSSICEGRACCGGRKLSLNGDLKSSVSFVPRQGFKDWYCSVNWFFLNIQQVNGNIWTNRDCRTSTTNKIEPLGNLKNAEEILSNLKTHENKEK